MKYFTLILFSASNAQNCFSGPTSRYTGELSTTKSGYSCVNWGEAVDPNDPHKHLPQDAVEKTHNFCRNPDGDLSGVWCYVTNSTKRWEYCDLKKCTNDKSVIYWTMFDDEQEVSQLSTISADPELVRQTLNEADEKFQIPVIQHSGNDTTKEYWAVAADYKHDRILWSDYRGNYIGVYDIKTNQSHARLEGMASGIENLAIDWLTGNIYWTDSTFRWIMVANSDMTHYQPILRAKHPCFGLAVDPIKGEMFYSQNSHANGAIIKTDLSGTGERKTILSFPTVNDVTSIFMDYEDSSRIYWTDYQGSIAVVMSATTDGDDILRHLSQQHSVFWNIVHYRGWLYVSDIAQHIVQGADGTPEKKYKIWIVNADDPVHDVTTKKNVHSYKINSRPRGLTIFSEFDQDNIQSGNFPELNGRQLINPCDGKSCSGICLQRGQDKTGVCGCQLGRELQSSIDGTCEPTSIQGDYLIVGDSVHGEIYKMELKELGEMPKVINPTEDVNDYFFDDGESVRYAVSAFNMNEIDHKKRFVKAFTVVEDSNGDEVLYWSTHDEDQSAIHYMHFERDEPVKTVITGPRANARDIEICPISNNIYWIEETSGRLLMSHPSEPSNDYSILVKPTSDRYLYDLTLDMENKYIYFTDPGNNGTRGQGMLMRSRLDGSEQTVILNNLDYPSGIVVDPVRRLLFLAEALSGKIYELSLTPLAATTGEKDINQLLSRQYNVAPMLTINLFVPNPIKTYIVEIDYDANWIYYVDRKKNHVQRVKRDVDDDPAIYGPYGSADFYKISAIKVKNSTTIQERRDHLSPFFAKYENFKQICSQHDCFDNNAYCIPVGGPSLDNLVTCGCKGTNTWDPETKSCMEEGLNADIEPPNVTGCPTSDKIINLPECRSWVYEQVSVPSFYDDVDGTNLAITSNIQENLAGTTSILYNATKGIHPIDFQAVDLSANEAKCDFMLIVNSFECNDLMTHVTDAFRSEFDFIGQTCPGLNGNQGQLVCKNSGKVIVQPIDNTYHDSELRLVDKLDVKCVEGQWMYPEMEGKFDQNIFCDDYCSYEDCDDGVAPIIPENPQEAGTEWIEDGEEIENGIINESGSHSHTDENNETWMDKTKHMGDNVVKYSKSNTGATVVILIIVILAITLVILYMKRNGSLQRVVNAAKTAASGKDNGALNMGNSNQAYSTM